MVASPLAAGYACLTAEERELGVALVELGGEVTNVSVYAGGMLVGLTLDSARVGRHHRCHRLGLFGIRRFQAERLKCVCGSAIASPADHREMIPVNGPGRGRRAPGRARRRRHEPDSACRTDRGHHRRTRHADERRRQGAEGDGLYRRRSRFQRAQVVITGGGAELAGLADYAQGALGMPVRIGRPPRSRGLPEAHGAPGFATLAGLVLYAAEDPVDIRAVGSRFTDDEQLWPGFEPDAARVQRDEANTFEVSRSRNAVDSDWRKHPLDLRLYGTRHAMADSYVPAEETIR